MPDLLRNGKRPLAKPEASAAPTAEELYPVHGGTPEQWLAYFAAAEKEKAMNPSGSKGKASKAAKSTRKPRAKPIKPTYNPDSSWICVCPSAKDRAWELESDSDDEDDQDRVEEKICRGPDCKCDKLADEHPEHTWVVTRAGWDLLKEWMGQKGRRDQDNYGLYVYNKFNAYGCTEVMQNILLAFDKEAKKPKKNLDVKALWKNIEAMAWFLNGDLFLWRMGEDSKSNAILIALFGTTLLTTINILVSQKLFTPDSELRNIGLILAKFLNFTTGVGDDELCRRGENKWKDVMVRLADEHGIIISGVYHIEDIVDKIRESTDPDSSSKKDRNLFDEEAPTWGVITLEFINRPRVSWKSWNWKKEFVDYCQIYSLADDDMRLFTQKGSFARRTRATKPAIGGDRFDITMMPEVLRKKFELGAGMSDDEE